MITNINQIGSTDNEAFLYDLKHIKKEKLLEKLVGSNYGLIFFFLIGNVIPIKLIMWLVIKIVNQQSMLNVPNCTNENKQLKILLET